MLQAHVRKFRRRISSPPSPLAIVPAWTSSATRSKTLPTPGQVAVGQQPLRPVGEQLGRRAAPGARRRRRTTTHTWPLRACTGRVGGDGVGEQHGVVEAVDRALGAGGEHADDAPEHGADERAAADADDGLVGGGAARSREPLRRRLAGAPRSKVMRTSVSSERPVPSSSDSASVAMSGRPRPRPGLSGRGTMPRPAVDDDERQAATVDRRAQAHRALAVGVGVDDDVGAGLGDGELDVRQGLVVDVERPRRARRRRGARRRRSPRGRAG